MLANSPNRPPSTGGNQVRARGLAKLSRRYPPLLSLIVALLIAVVVLPSALNLPQSNPTETPEFAPVPPEDDDPPPQTGNLSSLGVASSGGLTTGGDLGPGGFAAPPAGSGARPPSTKKCVGSPPKQTEDPMSPPCVPYFEGDNGGATYQGVTKDEIKVIIYMDGGSNRSYNNEDSPDGGTYCDLDLPPNTGGRGCYINDGTGEAKDHIWVKVSRAMSRYFNTRYQTYGRHVHYYIFWSNATSTSGRRADAADIFAEHQPFALIDQTIFIGFKDALADGMARRRTFLFSDYTGQSGSFFQKYAPQVWSFAPDIEHWADSYVGYVCTKIAGKPVAHAKNGIDNSGREMNGQQRRYGLMYTSDPAFPGLQLFARIAEQRLQTECGINVATRVQFPSSGYSVDTYGESSYAVTNVAKLREADVTTVLWLGGHETKTTQAMDVAKYYPELILAGDGVNDSAGGAGFQNPAAFSNAWVVSTHLREDRLDDAPGYRACKEGNPAETRTNCIFGNEAYRDHYMMFLAIQAAGPQLDQDSVDLGMHAIPPSQSTSPYVAACFFDPGDYTCTKDAMSEWFDPSGQSVRYAQPGCFRMALGGRRFLPDKWPPDDEVFGDPNQAPCDNYGGTYRTRAGVPQTG